MEGESICKLSTTVYSPLQRETCHGRNSKQFSCFQSPPAPQTSWAPRPSVNLQTSSWMLVCWKHFARIWNKARRRGLVPKPKTSRFWTSDSPEGFCHVPKPSTEFLPGVYSQEKLQRKAEKPPQMAVLRRSSTPSFLQMSELLTPSLRFDFEMKIFVLHLRSISTTPWKPPASNLPVRNHTPFSPSVMNKTSRDLLSLTRRLPNSEGATSCLLAENHGLRLEGLIPVSSHLVAWWRSHLTTGDLFDKPSSFLILTPLAIKTNILCGISCSLAPTLNKIKCFDAHVNGKCSSVWTNPKS